MLNLRQSGLHGPYCFGYRQAAICTIQMLFVHLYPAMSQCSTASESETKLCQLTCLLAETPHPLLRWAERAGTCPLNSGFGCGDEALIERTPRIHPCEEAVTN